MRNKKIEFKVLETFKELPDHLINFPLDIFSIIDLYAHNIRYVSYQQYANDTGCTLDEVKILCKSKTGCVHNKSEKYLIMYNNAINIIHERKKFTLAHEFGHIALEHFQDEIFCIAESDLHSIYEQQANYFASLLLAPTPILHELQLISITEIQKHFNLSKQAAEVALNRLKNYERSYNIQWHNQIINLLLKNTNTPTN